jgi:hypothetical protein
MRILIPSTGPKSSESLALCTTIYICLFLVEQKGNKSTVDSTVEEETSLLVGDMDIDALNDEELFKLLQENGISVGPIVGSTR